MTGESGETPEVSIQGDAQADVSQRSVVIKAEDRENLAGDDHLVGVNVAYYDSESGELLQEEGDFTSEGAGSYMLITEQTMTPVTEGIKCAAPGDRLVIAVSGEESQAFGMNFPGYTPGASVIAVADVVTVSELASSGTVRGLPSGFPGVATNEDGRPGIVLPPTAAPEGITSATRIVGEGAKVGAEDRLVLQLLIVDWEGNVVDNRWEGGPVMMGGETEMSEAGLTFRGEMTGQTVGSQQVIIDSSGEVPQVIVADILAAG
ncbi:MAG: peptidylprolyl isomerase [Leucobacter sp.]